MAMVEMVTTAHMTTAQTGIGPASLGEALRMLRHRSRLSRDELARRTGVSSGAISNYENDISIPAAPTLRRLVVVIAEQTEQTRSSLWEQLGALFDTPTA